MCSEADTCGTKGTLNLGHTSIFLFLDSQTNLLYYHVYYLWNYLWNYLLYMAKREIKLFSHYCVCGLKRCWLFLQVFLYSLSSFVFVVILLFSDFWSFFFKLFTWPLSTCICIRYLFDELLLLNKWIGDNYRKLYILFDV